MTGNTLEQRAKEVVFDMLMREGYGDEIARALVDNPDRLHLSGEDAFALVEAALRLSAGADWVSVEDRLPGPAEHVEVWPDPHDDTYSFYAHHNGGTNGVKAGRWYYSDREGYDREIRVTHWRKSTPGPEAAAPRHEPGDGV